MPRGTAVCGGGESIKKFQLSSLSSVFLRRTLNQPCNYRDLEKPCCDLPSQKLPRTAVGNSMYNRIGVMGRESWVPWYSWLYVWYIRMNPKNLQQPEFDNKSAQLKIPSSEPIQNQRVVSAILSKLYPSYGFCT